MRSEIGKRVLIYGAGRIARASIIAFREIYEDFDECVIGCAVTYFNNNPNYLEGISVREINQYLSDTEVEVWIAAMQGYIEQIESELRVRGFSHFKRIELQELVVTLENKWIDLAPERSRRFLNCGGKNKLTVEEYVSFLSRQLKTHTLNFEVNLADHCNLNCQCCNHFSPIAAKEFLDVNQYQKDMERMAYLYGDNRGKMMLLGGEPLLHPEVEKVIMITRNCFPNLEISLVTNGLLLPKMEKSFWKVMSENEIGLSVTKYPVAFDYDYWEKEAQQNGVSWSYGVLNEVCKTTYHFPIKDNPEFDPYSTYMKCAHANQCVALYKGRLYTCPQAAYVFYYNEFFGKDIPCKEEVSIDIYQASSYEEIETFLKEPNKMCSHCGIYSYTYNIPWARSKRQNWEWSDLDKDSV
ncbi:MAG: hypothetical protein K6F30_10150 [Lachnospiraceae bacterium]|nr:hypothetical protein [Lachnospiraceae bacterium]